MKWLKNIINRIKLEIQYLTKLKELLIEQTIKESKKSPLIGFLQDQDFLF